MSSVDVNSTVDVKAPDLAALGHPANLNIYDFLGADSRFTKFCEALVKAHIADPLKGTDPFTDSFTVFAPVDEFCGELVELVDTASEVTTQADRLNDLRAALQAHIVRGTISREVLDGSKPLRTVGGEEITVQHDGTGAYSLVSANGTVVRVDEPEHRCFNGIIYRVSPMLQPSALPSRVPAAQAAPAWKNQQQFLGGDPEAEAKLIAEWAEDIRTIQINLRKKHKSPKLARAFHAKMIAGIRNAELRVVDDIAEQYQVGFYRPGNVYPVIVRFSNAAGTVQPDSKADFRGIALRIGTGLSTLTDLLMTNGRVSHARNAEQFMIAARAGAGSRLLAIPRMLYGLGLTEMIRLLKTVRSGSQREIHSLATEQFWSRGAYQFGDRAVRFTLEPVEKTAVRRIDRETNPNYLRDEFIERLARGPVVFDLKVQQYTNEQETPLEDAAVEWTSEFVRIAQLHIPQQNLRSTANQADAAVIDGLEFSPWHTTEEFQPLGSINRARKLVYKSSQDHRSGRKVHGRRRLLDRLFFRTLQAIFTPINRFIPWHRLWTWLAVLNLDMFRSLLRWKNLYDTESREIVPTADPHVPRIDPKVFKYRQSDGTCNDLSDARMGAAGMRFGRNVPPEFINRDPDRTLLQPNPRLVSRELLTRHEFIPATSLNLLAAAWIQFMVHGWFDHNRWKKDRPDAKFIDVDLPAGDDWAHGDTMRVARTIPADGPSRYPAFANTQTHWWDGSQIYGSSPDITHQVRAHVDGKLNIAADGKFNMLPEDPEVPGIDLTGFNNNYWVGLSLFHSIFTLEHNAICDRLKSAYPAWNDAQLFETARLINGALMAKIHTVEWTPGILGHPALQIGMAANWWGLIGQRLTDLLGRRGDTEAVSGIPGSPTDHHAAPYSLTEEFSTVYKMHPLIPDEYRFHSHADGTQLGRKTFVEIQGKWTRDVRQAYRMSDMLYSFGIAHPGAITLNNYPKHLQNFETIRHGVEDVATADILRERERGVPRYNKFRKALRLPRINSFQEMTDNPQSVESLRKVYGQTNGVDNVDDVDTMIGMFAETPPKGFGFSDTAFRIFILMASRRLKSDRFFTVDWRPEVYTQEGMDWIKDNTMKTVILRHFPELGAALHRVPNTFAPWNAVGTTSAT